MAHGANMEGTLDELTTQLKTAYGLRSRLAHGSLSPFAPEVAAEVAPTVLIVERAIRGGVSFFAELGLLDGSPTRAGIYRAFDQLTAAARHWDHRRQTV